MIGTNERQGDILKIISSLDISPSMYENATEKYKAVAGYLGRHLDIQTTMYSQGSFAFGTVVRPLKNGKDADYDLDFVCEVDRERGEISAEELRYMIEKALSDGELYCDKLEIFDECITLHYAEESGFGFSIDIVPAAHESEVKIKELEAKAERPELIDTAIAIAMRDEGQHTFVTNNPKGFQAWFEKINAPFLDHSRAEYRQALFESTGFYNTVEDIPSGMERSSIQRVIQILKRNRDVFYQEFSDLKPISAIINVLVTDVASKCFPQISIFDLLNLVLKELCDSAACLKDKQNGEVLLESRIVGKRNKGWYITNPANPEDNLASKWNDDSRIPDKFFLWVEAAKKDLIDSINLQDDQFQSVMESAFGQDLVQKSLGEKYCVKKGTSLIGTAKPWRSK